MKEMKIALGQRLYKNNPDGTVQKGTITKIKKPLFSSNMKYVITWDNGFKDTVGESEIKHLIESRQEAQQI